MNFRAIKGFTVGYIPQRSFLKPVQHRWARIGPGERKP
jgi:hypothetical protein